MLTLASAQQAFRNAGIRVTPQRMMVVEVLVDNRTHPTVEAVYSRVRAKYPAVSLATVYHTLALLARHGLVLELHGGKDGLRCDPETMPHAHAYCEVCSVVSDIALPSDFNMDAVKLVGFTLSGAEISLYGRCSRCQSAN
jgi:Fur family peroxide stress response transcriptional regulator